MDHIQSGRQIGGRTLGLSYLKSFLNHRAEFYSKSISQPLAAKDFGSRISPYLTWGCLSLREVHHQSRAELRAGREALTSTGSPQALKNHLRGIQNFINRLWWRCHFIQKLETQPELEFEGVNPALEELRRKQFGEPNWEHFELWKVGQTGVPMVDASMRALREWGWINFRMRAMLISFACYNLKLPWRPVGLELAKLFVDFEPGIHWSQVLMQSGSTGINALRIYCPTKQARDQDPTGNFIRSFIPELSDLPLQDVYEPWLTPPFLRPAALALYPKPIVDLKATAEFARRTMFSLHKHPSVRLEARKVYQKLGSRSHPSFPRQNRPHLSEA
jgi:deoxyribodipyrimidine photo-lyase